MFYAQKNTADRQGIPGNRRHRAKSSPASFAPSDDNLPDLTGTFGQPDSTDFGTRKQKKSGNLSAPVAEKRRTGLPGSS